MTLSDIQSLTLREVLALSTSTFRFYIEKRATNNYAIVFVIETDEYSVLDFDLTQPTLSVSVGGTGIDLTLQLDLNATYQLDMGLFALSLGDEDKPEEISYEFEGISVSIRNQAIASQLVDALYKDEIQIPGITF